MTQQELIRRLKEYLPRSKYASQIEHVYLFGSYARNEQDEESDVDLTADFIKNHSISIFDLVNIVDELEKVLDGRKVDFGQRKYLSPYIKDRVEKDLIQVI